MPSSSHRPPSHSVARTHAWLESLPSNLKAFECPAPRHPVLASTCWRDHSWVTNGLLKTGVAEHRIDAVGAMLDFDDFDGVTVAKTLALSCGVESRAMHDSAVFVFVFILRLCGCASGGSLQTRFPISPATHEVDAVDGEALAVHFPLVFAETVGASPVAAFLRAACLLAASRNSLKRSSKLPTMAGVSTFFLAMGVASA